MLTVGLTFLSLILTSLPGSSKDALLPSDSTYFEEGMVYRKNGQWQKALATWRTGRRMLEQQARVDPRLGLAFIELVSEQSLKGYEAEATDFYLWGMSERGWARYREVLVKEVERVLPLLPRSESEAWRRKVQGGDASVLRDLRRFWLLQDPTPSTPANERLLEHWQRIAYARKHFKKAGNTVYGTDDRGLVYVKYGAPDRKKALVLGADSMELMRWSDLANFPGAKYANLRQGLLEYMTFPECEVWAYDSLFEEESVLFLFGPRDGMGAFGLRNGVEELIPWRAFQSFSKAPFDYRRIIMGGILPGAILQIMYYSQLRTFDPYFENRYYQIEVEWSQAESLYLQTGSLAHMPFQFARNMKLRSLSNKLYERYSAPRHFAPPQDTALDEAIEPLAVTGLAARVLDAYNRPGLILFAAAVANQDALEQGLTASLILRDDALTPLKQEHWRVQNPADPTVVFRLPHRPDYAHTTVAFESIVMEKEVARITSAGRVDFDLREPLNPDPGGLELSDLVLGVEAKSEIELPFPFVPSDRIWAPDPLRVYLEIYHLALDADGLARFTIDFEVAKLKGKRRSKKQSIALTFEFEAAASTSKESFEIDVSKLSSGEYELLVTVTDTVSGQRKQRTARFEVVE